jgi:aspartate racemase
MHKVASWIEEAVDLPLLHIVDVTADAIVLKGLTTVGLLGTRFTMEEDFYHGRLEARGISAIVPDAPDREYVNRVIYSELCCGVISDASREAFNNIIARLIERGARGVILGCTEIPLLVRQADVAVPLYDTGELHAAAAVNFALGNA